MNATARILFPFLFALLPPLTANAQSLISMDELRNEQAAQAKGGAEMRMKALPVAKAPRIDILSPNAQGATLVAPFEIRVKFAAEDGAQIVAESFKVLYGMLSVDITARVMKYGEFRDNTLRIEKANIPAGRHRLTLKIKDSEQREAQSELTLVVQEKKD